MSTSAREINRKAIEWAELSSESGICVSKDAPAFIRSKLFQRLWRWLVVGTAIIISIPFRAWRWRAFDGHIDSMALTQAQIVNYKRGRDFFCSVYMWWIFCMFVAIKSVICWRALPSDLDSASIQMQSKPSQSLDPLRGWRFLLVQRRMCESDLDGSFHTQVNCLIHQHWDLEQNSVWLKWGNSQKQTKWQTSNWRFRN